jgi:hypothetical protein
LEGLPAQYQYTDRTSETAKILGSLPIYPDPRTGSIGPASPVKVDHILNGYFGGIGAYALGILDAGISAAKGGEGPPKPASKLSDMPIIGQILKDSHNMGVDDLDRVYELRQQADSLYQAVHKLQAAGDPQAAHQLALENRQLLTLRPRLENMAKGLSQIRKKEIQIRASRSMAPTGLGGEEAGHG